MAYGNVHSEIPMDRIVGPADVMSGDTLPQAIRHTLSAVTQCSLPDRVKYVPGLPPAMP
jgi:hypothetical protein